MKDYIEEAIQFLDILERRQMANEIYSAINNLANNIADSNMRKVTATNMAEQNIHHTIHHSYTTEWDKNLHAIAETEAKCQIRRYKGICKIDECKNCETDNLLFECYNALSSCDKLKVDREVDAIIDAEIDKEIRQEYLEKKLKEDKDAEIYKDVVEIKYLENSTKKLKKTRDYYAYILWAFVIGVLFIIVFTVR